MTEIKPEANSFESAERSDPHSSVASSGSWRPVAGPPPRLSVAIGMSGGRVVGSSGLLRPQHYPGPHGAAFFDLDKTLMQGASAFHFAVAARQAGLVTRRQLLLDGYRNLRYRLRGASDDETDALRERVAETLSGVRASDLERLGARVMLRILPRLYPEILTIAYQHQDEGRPVYIVTAASEGLAEVLATVLAFDGALGSNLGEIVDGVYTGRAGGRFLYGPAKAVAISELAVRENIDLSQSYAYSDSVSDLPMLEVVGHPVVVNPDAELLERAQADGWQVLHLDPLGRRLAGMGLIVGLIIAGLFANSVNGRRKSRRKKAVSPTTSKPHLHLPSHDDTASVPAEPKSKGKSKTKKVKGKQKRKVKLDAEPKRRKRSRKEPRVKAKRVKIKVRRTKAPKTPKAPKVSRHKVPTVKVPSVKVPAVRVPNVKVSNVKVPNVKVPNVKVPAVKVPSVRVPTVKVPSVNVPSVKVPSVKLANPLVGLPIKGGTGLANVRAKLTGSLSSKRAHVTDAVASKRDAVNDAVATKRDAVNTAISTKRDAAADAIATNRAKVSSTLADSSAKAASALEQTRATVAAKRPGGAAEKSDHAQAKREEIVVVVPVDGDVNMEAVVDALQDATANSRKNLD